MKYKTRINEMERKEIVVSLFGVVVELLPHTHTK
jgi:hypothetical protein